MSSSVSSKCAFSQGGITINRWRNRLKGDIVEALQCVKCAIRQDLLFPEPAPSSTLEVGFSEDDNDGGEGCETAEGWDDLLMDFEIEDDGSGMDTELEMAWNLMHITSWILTT